MSQPSPPKLFGRAFYESLGSPKYIVAPMVDRSEFAWRLLTRSYLDEERSRRFLAYSPMLHARLFAQTAPCRDSHFQPTKESMTSKEKSAAQPWLDGNPATDRPLFVQFCANKPEELLEAAQYVAPYCDAVDLNLGCPQGIARVGHYGAFLQEDWKLIYELINKLHKELSIPVTAKMRILETKEKTLEYAKLILSAGASILTVHGRRREQKSHNTGLADWSMIRYLRDNLPPETVLFANGNILNSGDLEACMEATGVDGIMSAEGNLSDPTIFAKPPKGHDPREYWYSDDGKGGYRIDAVFRRYMDIIYTYVLERPPPERPPLYIPGDIKPEGERPVDAERLHSGKKPKRSRQGRNPNIVFMQGHLFQLLRPLITKHTYIRDALAQARSWELDNFERILAMVEAAVVQGLDDHASRTTLEDKTSSSEAQPNTSEMTFSQKTMAKYSRPWWVCQPYIRPLPEEAVQKGAIQKGSMHFNSEALATLEQQRLELASENGSTVQRSDKVSETETVPDAPSPEFPKATLVCG